MKDTWEEPYQVVIEMENGACRVLAMLRKLGIQQFRIINVSGFEKTAIRHLVELPKKHAEKVYGRLNVHVRRKGCEKAYLCITTEGCDVCRTLLSRGAFLVSGRLIGEKTFNYSFVTPDSKSFSEVLGFFKEYGKFRVRRIRKFGLKGRVLTERQEKVLWVALKMGFFDFPRKIEMRELAEILGIAPSTLSEILRRGIRRVLESYYES